jgi:cobalt-zinc-cadmium efflux system membrane fusion protein
MPGLVGLLLVGGLIAVGVTFLKRHPMEAGPVQAGGPLPHVSLLSTNPDVLRLPPDYETSLQVQTAEIQPAPPPMPLRLPGSLLLDSNKLGRIHCLFNGEVVSIGKIEDPTTGKRRPLAYGDRVPKGQVLAHIWSKDVGEKKSELVDAISRLAVDKALLDRYLKVDEGAIAGRAVDDARRNYEADLIAVARAERTLRSWRMTEGEIEAVKQEAEKIRKRKAEGKNGSDPGNETWAELVLRAPQAGVIVEKNVTPGDVIDPTVVLFQIVDTGRVQVMANIYEEDLHLLQRLEPQKRTWKVSVQTAQGPQLMTGQFEQIGQIIDQTQHTGAVIGWLTNDKDVQLKAGQFITALIDLPPDPSLLAIPASALIEEGDAAYVLLGNKRDGRVFTLRKVSVATRGRTLVLIRKEPPADPGQHDLRPLEAGDRVITTGSLEMAAELATLKASPRTP